MSKYTCSSVVYYSKSTVYCKHRTFLREVPIDVFCFWELPDDVPITVSSRSMGYGKSVGLSNGYRGGIAGIIASLSIWAQTGNISRMPAPWRDKQLIILYIAFLVVTNCDASCYFFIISCSLIASNS
jgi:hypothetical protein